MKFHPNKCKVLTITNKRKIIIFDYKIRNKRLEKFEHAKYLGVQIDKKLLWKYHVSSITSKANHCRHFLQWNLVTCNQETKLQCYKIFVCPIVEYASSIWDSVGNKKLHCQLEQVQKKAARWNESNWDYKSIASNMEQNLGINSLAVRRDNARLKLLHNIYYNKKFLSDSVTPKRPRCADTRFINYSLITLSTCSVTFLFIILCVWFKNVYNGHFSLLFPCVSMFYNFCLRNLYMKTFVRAIFNLLIKL